MKASSRPDRVLGWTDSRSGLADERCDFRLRDEPTASDDDACELSCSQQGIDAVPRDTTQRSRASSIEYSLRSFIRPSQLSSIECDRRASEPVGSVVAAHAHSETHFKSLVRRGHVAVLSNRHRIGRLPLQRFADKIQDMQRPATECNTACEGRGSSPCILTRGLLVIVGA